MSLLRNILTTLFARLTVLGLALISSIVLARLLGPEGRGLFALVLLPAEFVQSFAALGLAEANAVYAGLVPDGRPALVWHSAAVAGVVGGLAAAGGMFYLALGAPGFEALLRGPLWPYLLLLSAVPGGLVSAYWAAIIRGMNRILLLNVVEVGIKVASLTLVLVFVAGLDDGVPGAVWASYTVSLGSVLLMLALLRYVGVWSAPVWDWSLWKRTGRFALPAHCGSVVGYLNYRVDQFFIAALLPPQQLGFYVIAVDLAERLWILTGAVANALLPHLTTSRHRDPGLAAVVARHVMLWTGGACFVVFALAEVVVRFLYSSEFAPTAAPLRWLLPGIFTLAISKVLAAEILARERIYYVLWVSAFGLLLNMGGNLLLVPRMGITGAAFTSTIAYSVVALAVIWYYLRETGVPWTALMPRWSDLRPYGAVGRRLQSFLHLARADRPPLRS